MGRGEEVFMYELVGRRVLYAVIRIALIDQSNERTKSSVYIGRSCTVGEKALMYELGEVGVILVYYI